MRPGIPVTHNAEHSGGIMRTKFILVDHENVPEIDLSVLAGEATPAIICVGVKQMTLKTDLVLKIQAMGNRGEFVKCPGICKDALDHVLAFRIGQLTRECPDAEFHIVSDDKGFDVLIAHMKKENLSAKRIESSKSGSKMSKQKATKSIASAKAKAKVEAIVEVKTTPQRAQFFMNALRAKLGEAPPSLGQLRQMIRVQFANLEDKDLESLITSLRSRKFLAVDGDKVTYPGLGPKG